MVAFNRTVRKVDAFLENEAKGTVDTFHLFTYNAAPLESLALGGFEDFLANYFRYRQIDRRRSFDRGVRFEAKEAPSHDAARTGWKSCR